MIKEVTKTPNSKEITDFWEKLKEDLATELPQYPFIDSPIVSIVEYQGVSEVESRTGTKYRAMKFVVIDEQMTKYLLTLPVFVVDKSQSKLKSQSFRIKLDGKKMIVY